MQRVAAQSRVGRRLHATNRAELWRGAIRRSSSLRQLERSGDRKPAVIVLSSATGGKRWLACGYLVATALISVVATALIRDRDLHFS
jgi:hypothetical protein